MKVGSIGEFALIDRIRAQVPNKGNSILVGIGDDSAVVRPMAGHMTVAATDMLVEGVHFDLSWHDATSLGRKSLNVNISDILVMGGVPRHALLSLAIPPEFSVESLDALIAGFREVCIEHGISLIGGDTSASPHDLLISVTVLGEVLESMVVRRSGASPGDTVFVTGTLGNSAAGLRLLRSKRWSADNSDHLYLAARHLNPRPRREAVGMLAENGLASSMIDISDGLSSELHHLARASAVGINISETSLPHSPALHRYAAASGESLLDLLLHGGEEYEACFTVRAEKLEIVQHLISSGELDATAIGTAHKGSGVTIEYEDGRKVALEPQGYEHFSV